MSNPTPNCPQKSPIKIQVEAGKTYQWCTCGNSKNQPMCDGSHQGGPFTPLAYTPAVTEDKWFCACKHTGTPPLCDGSHKKL
jgi:CDGSH-type Zn-finger protein